VLAVLANSGGHDYVAYDTVFEKNCRELKLLKTKMDVPQCDCFVMCKPLVVFTDRYRLYPCLRIVSMFVGDER